MKYELEVVSSTTIVEVNEPLNRYGKELKREKCEQKEPTIVVSGQSFTQSDFYKSLVKSTKGTLSIRLQLDVYHLLNINDPTDAMMDVTKEVAQRSVRKKH